MAAKPPQDASQEYAGHVLDRARLAKIYQPETRGEQRCNQNRTLLVGFSLTILPPQTPKVEGNSYINNVTDYAYSIRVIHSYNYIKII